MTKCPALSIILIPFVGLIITGSLESHPPVISQLNTSLLVLSTPPTVLIDSKALTAKSDPPITVHSDIRWFGKELRATFVNDTNNTVECMVKVSGLPSDKTYDLYYSGEFKGSFRTAELESGVKVTVPGGVFKPEQIRYIRACMETLQDGADAMLTPAHLWPLSSLYRSQALFLESLLNDNDNLRSSQIIVLESGYPVNTDSFLIGPSPVELRNGYAKIPKILHDMRDSVYQQEFTTGIRDQHLGWTLPLELRIDGSGETLSIRITNFSLLKITANAKVSNSQRIVKETPLTLDHAKSASISLGNLGSNSIEDFTLELSGKAGIYPFKRSIKLVVPSK